MLGEIIISQVLVPIILTNVPDFIQIEEGGLHTNFKIKNEGEGLYFFNANKQLADSVQVVALPADKSYGRYPDGGSVWKYFLTPTPGETNMCRKC